MSALFMKEAITPPQPSQEPAVSEKDRRRNLRDAFKKGGSRGAVKSKETQAAGKKSGEKEALAEMILGAETTQIAQALYNDLGKDVMPREEFLELLKKRKQERVEAVAAVTTSEKETKGELQPPLVETSATGGEVTDQLPMLTTPAEITEKEVQVQKPEAATPEISTPAFATLEELEEAFGRGDIELEAFLKEKARLVIVPPAGEAASSGEKTSGASPEDQGLYEFLKDYVAQREIRGRGEFEEEKLRQRNLPHPKKHPIRGREEEAGRIKRTAPEVPPTKEIQEITSRMQELMDQTQARWKRLIAYKQLNPRTFKMVEELAEYFRSLELLRNQLKTEEIKARGVFEKETASSRRAVQEEPSTRIVEGSRDSGLSTIGDILRLKKAERKEKEQKRLASEEPKRRQKFMKALDEYSEGVEEAFGRGDIELNEFEARRELVKRLRTSTNVTEELNTAFGKDTLKRDEYMDLKSKFKTLQH